jgi:Arc/MetJ-type ribon-helix-helix transcriptional regulator
MPRGNWKSISLPASLIKEVDQAVEDNPSFWTSRADFVTYAVRRLLEQDLKGPEGIAGD